MTHIVKLCRAILKNALSVNVNVCYNINFDTVSRII